MPETLEVDICVIGAGSGGLSVTAGAAMLGAPTVLIEKGRMGGDCLNYGCVPSKALLAAGHAARAMRDGGRFGVTAAGIEVDGARVYRHVHETIAAIAPNDSVERFQGLGVTVIQAEARFTGPAEVAVEGRRIRARRFVVATGSHPLIPPIPGLAGVPYLTNETVFERDAVPEHLIVVGGGPIGVEMAQAHRHLGGHVTLIELATLMPKDDPELVDVVRQRLIADGIDVREGAEVAAVERDGNGIAVAARKNGAVERIAGSHLLVAAGRRASTDGLDLEAAGIAFDGKGIKVDTRLRTTNKRVFAVGDVAGGPQFTHAAGYHAGIVIRNALFRLPAKVDYRAFPWVTYTAPELAQVGLTESAAREREADIRILRWPFADNDRARTEADVDGLIKVVTTPKGRILGAGMVGRHAGELIQPWVLAMASKLKVGAIASVIVPYPTLGEAGKRVAGSFYAPTLFGERTKKLVRFLRRFG